MHFGLLVLYFHLRYILSVTDIDNETFIAKRKMMIEKGKFILKITTGKISIMQRL